jgi:hypothetical protein
MMKCPFCNFENEDGVLFCEQCKSDLGTDPVVAAGKTAVEETLGAATMPLAMAETPVPLAAVVVTEVPHAETVPLAEVAESTAQATLQPLTLAELMPVAKPVAVEAPLAVSLAEPAVGTPPPGETAQPALSAKPKLVVLRGQRLNAEYPLYDGDNYIGRADDKPVDIDLEDQEPEDRVWSSRQHALITLGNGQLAIEDLKSLNGTFVNRARLEPGKKLPLQVGDVIQIGTVQMKVKA